MVRTRYNAVLVAGAVAGLGGAFYTTVQLSQFGENMTGGAGYIALAAVIFGKWDPVRAAFAGLLFGFASNLQNVLSVVGSPVPSQFMLMVPYAVRRLQGRRGGVGHGRPLAHRGDHRARGLRRHAVRRVLARECAGDVGRRAAGVVHLRERARRDDHAVRAVPPAPLGARRARPA